MKTYLNKYIVVIFLLSTGLFTSCKKYINEGPIDAPTDASFWTSERAAQSGLAGAYGLLRTALFPAPQAVASHPYFIFGDATANEFSGYSDWTIGSLTPDNRWNFNYVPYNEYALHDWTNFYQVISQCNLIISKVGNIPNANFTDDPAATKKQILGEAYFIRAYCYYYLTEVWGQPVIVTQAYTDPIHAQPVARSSDAAGFEQVVSDLKTSIGLLQYGYTDGSKVAVQANKGAAFALLSKVYMWQKQYQLASAAADSVIQNGQYQLESAANYANIFLGHDQESIFELNMLYSPNQNESQSGSNNGIFGIFLSNPFVNGKSGDNWQVNLDVVNNLFDTTSTQDARLKATFYGLHSSNPLMVKYANVIYQNPSQKTIPFVSNNLVLLRLSDIMLIKAEAEANLGNLGTSAIYLNMVRQRAGASPYVPDTQQNLIYTIMDERGRELFGEGQWFFDLVRSGLIDDVNYDNSIDGYIPARVNGKGCQWPLNLRALLPQDPLLTQNPWWAGQ